MRLSTTVQHLLQCSAALTLLALGPEDAFPEDQKVIATIIAIKGECYSRTLADLQPKPMKNGDLLQAGQEVFCRRDGEVSVQYKNTNGVLQFKAHWQAVAPSLDAGNYGLRRSEKH